MKLFKWLKLWKVFNAIKGSIDMARVNSRKLVAGIFGSLAAVFAILFMAMTGASPEAAEGVVMWLTTWTGGYIGAQGLLDFFSKMQEMPDENKWKSRKFWLTIFMQLVSGVLAPVAIELGADPEVVLDFIEKLTFLLLPMLGGIAAQDLGGKLRKKPLQFRK